MNHRETLVGLEAGVGMNHLDSEICLERNQT